MFTDFEEEASVLFTDFNRILRRRLPDCLRFFTGIWREGIRIVSGFLPVVGEEAAGLFTNFFRILGRRRPDCLRIFTGFWQGGFPIV